MRLFVAIDFEERRDYLSELQKRIDFPGAKLNFTKIFHLTLKFLGEVQPNKVDSIIESLGAIRSKPFTLSLDGIGVFPSESFIRVVWIGVQPEEPVLNLQSAVDESLQEFFKRERNFKAHTTLARVKFVENKKEFAEHLKHIQVGKKLLHIKEFLLIKSELKPGGHMHTILERFALSD